MFRWSGFGWVAAVIVIGCFAIGLAVEAFVAEQIHPGLDDSFELARITHPMLDLIAGAALLISAIAVWFWGRWINRDGNDHTLYFIPVQFVAALPALAVGIVAFSFAGTTPIERARGGFVNDCERRLTDVTDQQCVCLGDVFSAELRPATLVSLFRVADNRHGDPVIDTFLENEYTRLPADAQDEFLFALEQSFDRCLAPAEAGVGGAIEAGFETGFETGSPIEPDRQTGTADAVETAPAAAAEPASDMAPDRTPKTNTDP